jgi:uncharacterized protein YjbJ (UPF0337 family)
MGPLVPYLSPRPAPAAIRSSAAKKENQQNDQNEHCDAPCGHSPARLEAAKCGLFLAPPKVGTTMNWDLIEGNWKQATGALRKKWGKLTDDDLAIVKGNREMLAGKLQERYGVAIEEGRRKVAEFAEQFRADVTANGHQEKDPVDDVAIEGDPVDMKTLKIGT